MPINECQRNGEQGWQWGEEGKCYLPSEEGSEEAAKKKAIEQAIAAGAGPDEFAEQPIEMMTLNSIPILKAGVYREQSS